MKRSKNYIKRIKNYTLITCLLLSLLIGILPTLDIFKFEKAEAAPNGTGMLIYDEDGGNLQNPHYRTWSPDDLSSESDMLMDGLGTSVYDVLNTVIEAGTTRNEYIRGAVNNNGELFFQIFDGSSWVLGGSAPEQGRYANFLGGMQVYGPFDIAYEKTSGDAVVVYEKTNADDTLLYYRVWDGSNWSAEQNLDFDAVDEAPDNVHWIEMETRQVSGADEIMLAWKTIDGDALYGAVWDGDSWENIALINAAATNVNQRPFDVAWEGTSDQGMIVYGTGTTTDHSVYDISAGTWTDGSSSANPGEAVNWLSLAGDPNSDYISMIITSGTSTSTADVAVDIWNGSDWTTVTVPADDTDINNNGFAQGADVAWEYGGDRSLFVWRDGTTSETQLRYMVYDRGSNQFHAIEDGTVCTNTEGGLGSVEVITSLANAEDALGPCSGLGTWAGTVSGIELTADPNSSAIMLIAANETSLQIRPEAQLWNGDANGTWATQTANMAALETAASPGVLPNVNNPWKAYNFEWRISGANSTGIFTYDEDGTPLAAMGLHPHYRVWSSGDFGSEQNAYRQFSRVGSESIFSVIKASPTKDEYLSGRWTHGGTLSVQIWDGSAWVLGTNSPNSNGIFTSNLTGSMPANRGFDIAYEQTTGVGMVVYEDSATPDTSLKYRTLTNGTWSSEQTIDYSAVDEGNDVTAWVELIARPGGEEIMLGWKDTTGLGIYAAIWDGDSWEDIALINGSGNADINHQTFDVEWEATSDQGMIVYGTGSATDYSVYDISDSNWTDGSGSLSAGQITWLRLDADPNSDYIAMIAIDSISTSSSDVNVDMWNGSNWTTVSTPTEDNDINTYGYAIGADVAWEYTGDRALFVWRDGTTSETSLRYMVYDRGDNQFQAIDDDSICTLTEGGAGTTEVVTSLANAEDAGGPCSGLGTWAGTVSGIVLTADPSSSKIAVLADNETVLDVRPEMQLWNGDANGTWLTQTTNMGTFELDASTGDLSTSLVSTKPYSFAFNKAETAIVGLSGSIYIDEGSTLINCSSAITVSVSVNGGTPQSTDCVAGAGTPGSFSVRVLAGSDDVEEAVSTGSIDLTSSDLEIVDEDFFGNQELGLRFTNVTVPPGATITDAYIQFEVDETTSGTANLTIYGEDIDDAPTFTTTTNDVTSRTKTSASVAWSPPNWTSVNDQGVDQQTSDLSTIVQEIIDRGGWASGNDMAFIITGTGQRIAESYEGESANAPQLNISYETGGGVGNGQYEFEDIGASAGDILTIYINGEAQKAVTVTESNGSTLTDVDLYVDHLIVRHDNGGSLTIDDLAVWDSSDDSDIFFTATSGSPDTLTVDDGKELYVWSGDTFAPGGDVNVDDIKIVGTLTGGSDDLNISGNWANQGTFTSNTSTVNLNGNNFDITTGLLGYWKMDENSWNNDCATSTLMDSSGNDKHGNSCPNGSGITTPSQGKYGNAINLNGSSQYFAIPDPGLPTTDFTYSIWVNLDDVSDESLFKISDGSGVDQLGLDLSSGVVSIRINGSSVAASSQTLSTGTWYHLAITRDGSNLSLYINGEFESSATDGSTLSFSTCELLIGVDTDSSCTGGLSNYTDGKLDEFKVYNRDLNAEEIYALYTSSSDPQLYLKLNEGSGTTANDFTPNGNNASFTGTPTWSSARYGNGLDFDGSTEYIEIPDNDTLEPQFDMTLSFWANLDQNASTVAHDIVFARKIHSSSPWQSYQIFQQSSDNKVCFNWINSSSGASTVCGDTALSTSTWYYITALKSGSNLYLYINGSDDSASPVTGATGSILDSDDGLVFGDDGGLTKELDGKMDDIRLYNYARSNSEIAIDMLGSMGNLQPQRVTGTTSFYNLSATTASNKIIEFQASTTFTVTNNLTFTGTSCGSSLLTLRSTTIGTAWSLDDDSGGTTSVDYVDVKDSNATDQSITAANGINSGNNTNWSITECGYGSNSAPLDPTSLDQKTTSDVTIDPGEWVSSDSVKFTANVSDTDSTDTLYLCVEVLPITTTTFTDTDTLCGSGAAYSGTPVAASVTISGLTTDEIYHWQARTKDDAGLYSNWVTYSGEIDDLAGYWAMDESSWTVNCSTGSVLDSSGNANHGRACPNSTGPAGGATGIWGNAGNFDGSNDYVSVPDHSSLHFSDLTVSVWVNPTTNNTSSGIVYKRNSFGTMDWGLFHNTNGRPSFIVGESGAVNVFANSPPAIATSTWTHLSVTKSGDEYKFYTNGVLQDTKTSSQTWTDSDPIILGSTASSSGFFNGLIDEVRVYNYARSEKQVIADMGNGGDFGIQASNQAPDDPEDLDQLTVGGAPIAVGTWLNVDTLKLSVTASDPDASDTLYLCYEIDTIFDPFADSENGCSSGNAYSGTPITIEHTLTGVTEGNAYHWQVRIKDAAGAYSDWVSFGANAEDARDFGIDTTDPTGGVVYDGSTTAVDITFNDGSLSQLHANWDSFDFDASGLDDYEYSIGTTPGGTTIKGWTNNSTSTSVTATGLTLQSSVLYYFNVRANDNAGNSAVVSSNGQFVAPSISFALSSNTINFANLNGGNTFTDTKTTTLTTSTNAYNGYVIRLYKTGVLTSSSSTIADFSGGSYAAPSEWTSQNGFGYTSDDTSVQGVNLFNDSPCLGSGNAPCYAPFSSTAPGDIVADHTATISGSPVSNEVFTITYKVKTSTTQAAGTYSTNLIYSVIPQY